MTKKVLVVGSGNVGVAVGMGLSSVGHSVVYLDKNSTVLANLEKLATPPAPRLPMLVCLIAP